MTRASLKRVPMIQLQRRRSDFFQATNSFVNYGAVFPVFMVFEFVVYFVGIGVSLVR
jgi:hypothetical protein